MSLLDCVDRGDVDGVVAALAGLGPAERRALLPELTRRQKELSADWWKRSEDCRLALLVAGLGCHTAPSAAFSWVSGRPFNTPYRVWEKQAVLAVVGQHSPEWQAEVLRRIAERRPDAWADSEYLGVERLARATGQPVPTTDRVVVAWQQHHHCGWTASDAQLRGLLPRLAQEPSTPSMVLALFDIVGIRPVGLSPSRNQLGPAWRAVILGLIEAGVVAREEILDRCLARLARGGRPSDQRGFLHLLEDLAPTTQESAPRIRTYLPMLDAQSTVAAHAQAQLAELDAAGLLDLEHLVEASASVFFRSEKTLLRTQLAWLDRSGRRSPDWAAAAVRGAALAFGNADAELHERALKLAARHLTAAGPALLPELRAATKLLGPAQAARAAALFGLDAPAGPDGTAPYEEVPPPIPPRVPLAGPLDGPVAVAQELAAVMLASDENVAAFERTLDGLVRESYRDPESLRATLNPVLRDLASRESLRGERTWLGRVAAAAVGEVPPKRAHAMLQGEDPLWVNPQERFRTVLAARVQEAAALIVLRRTPFLLATPSYAYGGLEAAALVERLAALEAVDGRAGAADFSQALLRVLPTDDPSVLAAAGQLRSAEGRHLARWLAEGGLPGQHTERLPAEGRSRPLVTQPGLAPEHQALLHPDLGRILGPLVDPEGRRVAFAVRDAVTPHALAMLPCHREELAARLGNAILDARKFYWPKGKALLAQLVEAGGPAGPAVHLTLACALGSASAPERTAAVDALLLLAAQGALDPDRLGTDLAETARNGTALLSRVPRSLRQAADAGAYGTLWAVLRAALPGMLTPEPVRGVPELLSLAADCAARIGATGPLPVVEALAAQHGSSRLLKEARTLHTVLTAGPRDRNGG
ncbi:DUF6493 family protein [Kitasatospora sp. GP82]|uniref:DUF7825 domain-containing protein n=1 Tax=Kitasatospora sp. GP82 TaxID=3035089 RepID=UPI002473E5D2|nr:DUF6493 family protein [Kitasatospora sp. GP82]MDH6123470.1 hypothetical protein [Kitasatospora sp. GP82]